MTGASWSEQPWEPEDEGPTPRPLWKTHRFRIGLTVSMALAAVAVLLLVVGGTAETAGDAPVQPRAQREPAAPTDQAPRVEQAQTEEATVPAVEGFAVTSESVDDRHPPEHAIDGDLSTRWSPGAPGASISVDMAKSTAIDAVEIAWLEGMGRKTGFTIETAQDGKSWSEAFSGSSSGRTAWPERYELNATGRWLRVTPVDNGGAVGISHLRLEGDSVPEQLQRRSVQERNGDPAPATDELDGRLVVNADFEDLARGTMTAETLRRAFDSDSDNGGGTVPNAEGTNLSSMSVVDNPTGRGQVLAVDIPRDTLSGMNFAVNLDSGGGYEEAWLSYRVQFAEGFDFAPWGGKLPGLAGGPDGQHGNKVIPAGCVEVDGSDGFSARSMWVSWMDESDRQPVLDQYLYHMDKESNCGDTFLYEGASGLPVLEAGRWYHVQHRVRVNEPGKRNGVVEAWLDGEQVLHLTDLGLRDSRDLGVNVLYMAGFFGGDDARWKHDQDETMYFDDIVVHGMDRIGG